MHKKQVNFQGQGENLTAHHASAHTRNFLKLK